MGAESDRRYEFGPFVLDTAAGELTRERTPVPLMPTEYRLLLEFLEKPNRLLTKEELLEAVWPDAHVTEGSLARAIANLRDALGDDPHAARYIATVPRRGYRWIGETAPEIQSALRLFCDGRSYLLRQGENVLGRSDQSVVPIDSSSVSRRHALIVVTGEEAVLVDLQSTNGTYVGDERVKGTAPLRDQDVIRVGRVTMIFRSRGSIAAESTDALPE